MSIDQFESGPNLLEERRPTINFITTEIERILEESADKYCFCFKPEDITTIKPYSSRGELDISQLYSNRGKNTVNFLLKEFSLATQSSSLSILPDRSDLPNFREAYFTVAAVGSNTQLALTRIKHGDLFGQISRYEVITQDLPIMNIHYFDFIDNNLNSTQSYVAPLMDNSYQQWLGYLDHDDQLLLNILRGNYTNNEELNRSLDKIWDIIETKVNDNHLLDQIMTDISLRGRHAKLVSNQYVDPETQAPTPQALKDLAKLLIDI